MVKVLDQRGQPKDLRLEGPDVQFFEVVSQGLVTITYWGSAPLFSP